LCLSPEGGLGRVVTASPTRGWPWASHDYLSPRGWPQVNRDCLSHPSFPSGESLLPFPPGLPRASCYCQYCPGLSSGESCLLVLPEGGHGRVVAACPTKAWPRVSRVCVSCPRVCPRTSRNYLSCVGLASSESSLPLPPESDLGQVMIASLA
jgi:hypothetical protein